jgi:putative flippase GtrA
MDQLLKFGVVGTIAFAIDYGLLMVLTQLVGMPPVPAAAISFVVSLVFNYLASMRFVFSHRDDLSRSREFLIFLVLSAVGLGINELIVWVGTSVLGTSALWVSVTKFVATAVVMVWNFLSRRRWLDAGG